MTELLKKKHLIGLLIFTFIAKYYALIIFEVNFNMPMPLAIRIFTDGLMIVLFGILAFNIKLQRKEKIILIISIIMSLLSKDELLLTYIILCLFINSNKIEDSYIIKSYFIISCIFYIIIMLGGYLGILNGSSLYYRGESLRNPLGFGNPNTVFFAILPIYAAYIYLRFDKYSILDRIFILLSSIFIYYKTYSRTGLATMIIVLIIVEIVRKININKLARLIISNIPLICFFLSIFLALTWETVGLNDILSRRPEYWNLYIQNANMLSGIDISQIEWTPPLDNSYIFSISNFGIINTIVIGIVIYIGFYMIVKKGDKKSICIGLIFFIYALGENVFFNKAINFSLIIILNSFMNYEFRNFIQK